jgi:hypothetical protein
LFVVASALRRRLTLGAQIRMPMSGGVDRVHVGAALEWACILAERRPVRMTHLGHAGVVGRLVVETGNPIRS